MDHSSFMGQFVSLTYNGVSRVQKKALEGVNARLTLVMKSGKYQLGIKETIRSMRTGKAQMVILSENTPPLRRSQIEYLAMLGGVKVLHYAGSFVLISECVSV